MRSPSRQEFLSTPTIFLRNGSVSTSCPPFPEAPESMVERMARWEPLSSPTPASLLSIATSRNRPPVFLAESRMLV